MRSFLLILFLFPLLTFSQRDFRSDGILLKIEQLRSLSKLDSIPRDVDHFSNWFDTLNVWHQRYPWLYIYQDTIYFDGKFGVGSIVIDPHFEFSGVKYGLWRNYYSTGKLYSVGEYSVAARIYCTPSGPTIEGYSYRTGHWEYMYESGEKMASGVFKVKKNSFGECKSDYELISVTTKNWKFYPLIKSEPYRSQNTRLMIEKISW